MIRLNEKDHPEFQDINVRQAMNYAIDKQAIIDTVYFGLGSVADSPLPRTPSYVAQTPYSYDLDKAKELMAKSAFPNGFATTLVIDPGDTVASGVASIVKEQLAAIGIDVAIQQVDPGAQAEMIQSYGYDMVYKLFSADTFDDNQYICYVMSNVCGIDAYWSGYNNPQVEALVTALNSETDPATRLDKLAQIQSLVWNDADHLYIANVDGAGRLEIVRPGLRDAPDAALLLRDDVPDLQPIGRSDGGPPIGRARWRPRDRGRHRLNR